MWMRRKTARVETILVIAAEAGRVLYEGELERMALPEALILKLSVEFFNDPAPCQIHRSAVMKRVFMEIEENLTSGASRDISALSPACARYFCGYPNGATCRVERREVK